MVSSPRIEAASLPPVLAELVRLALDEDAPEGDLTSGFVVPEERTCLARLQANQDGVLAGTSAASAAFALTAEQDDLGLVEVRWDRTDADRIAAGDVLATVVGPARPILRAERVAVNLLSHLSGVASLTRLFADAAAPAKILCTRKTLPGLRALERDAVAAGGGVLHRASLSDAILVKDNHVTIAGSVAEAVGRAKASGLPVEVEVDSISDLDEAIRAGADRVLLDNFFPDQVRAAINRCGDADRLEISGGVTLETVKAFTAAGARWISVGRLTHSAPSLDMSLEVVE